MKSKKKAGFKKNSHKTQTKVKDSQVTSQKNDSQKLQQLEQQQPKQQQPQHHKNNILLIVVVVLLFIAVLFVFNLNATQREKAALKQQEQLSDYVPYEDIVDQKQTVSEEKQAEQQQKTAETVPDVPKETIVSPVVSEEQLVKQQESSQTSNQQYSTLESQLSSDYNQYFLGGCKDSDGGKNFFEQGSTVSKTGSAELDQCSTAKQYPNRLYEFYCDKNEMARKMIFECLNSCKDGACVAVK
ncbi:hypothetical protein HZA96_06170 [Candidatus Woesearchaeota archaeon]|nr:hypothetical protein [Candidatus Woesearchaeota archaeon]